MLNLLLAKLVHAQHGPDGPGKGPINPFIGSSCNCSAYCAGECAINATGAANKTYYRMTPGYRENADGTGLVPGCPVLDMTNKNVGDIGGDSGFLLARQQGVAFFQGDVPNNTDLVIQFALEVDGNWGPYGHCNPPTKDMSGGTLTPFSCRYGQTGGGGGKTHHYACNATTKMCDRTFDESGSFTNQTLCTETCSKKQAPPSFLLPHPAAPTPAPSNPGNDTNCLCPRMNKTVGVEHNRHAYGTASVMGLWLSFPMDGQCNGTHYVGDGSGCTWRVVERVKIINATCMYERIDDNVMQYNAACFAELPPTATPTSTAWQACFANATANMTMDQLLETWPLAFESEDPAKGGCASFIPPQDVPLNGP